jgi:hypothetical protein
MFETFSEPLLLSVDTADGSVAASFGAVPGSFDAAECARTVAAPLGPIWEGA